MTASGVTRRRAGALGLAAGVFAGGSARADGFSAKPIHLIMPFTPGGTGTASHIATEIDRWWPVLKAANVKLE